jgi:hypothetical protein
MNPLQTRTLTLLLVISLVVSLAAPATAQSNPPWAESMYDDFSDMVPKYNENADSLDLGLGNGLLENQRVTVRVTEGSATAFYWFTTDGGKRIVETGEGKHPEGATLVVKTSRQTLTSVASAENPVAAFREGVRDNEITFSGKTPKTFVIGVGVTIGQTLGLFG